MARARPAIFSAPAASQVYRLLGREAIPADTRMPDLHKPIMTMVSYHIRGGKHEVTDYDWEPYLNFANQQMH